MKSLSVISLGLGVQSTAMYYMSSLGILPRADVAIFADTGGEKTATLEYLKFLKKWKQENNGIRIIVVRERDLYKDLLNTDAGRFASIPSFTKNKDGSVGMLRRQCTGDYKIWQVDQAIRKLYKLKPRQRNIKTTVWKGISLEEVERMSIPEAKWKVFYYPFLGYTVEHGGNVIQKQEIERMYRANIIQWYNEMSLPAPEKSSCVFCPYMSDKDRLHQRTKFPKDHRRAVKVDNAIRNSTKKGIESPIYLHSSCQPLSEVDLSKDQTGISFGECSGNCHI